MKVKVKAHPLPMARDRPRQNTRNGGMSWVWMTDADSFADLSCQGYTTLAANPEIVTAVNTIARLVGSMTIHLMQNLGNNRGDIRITNELSRLVDIEPNRYMNRSNFIQWIIRTLYLEGRGNAVVWPRTQDGVLRELRPVPPAYASFVADGLWGYRVYINGMMYEPEQVLHFCLNPGSFYPWIGEGYTLSVTDVANNLKQAATTEKGFMSSKWKPGLIVKIDGIAEEFRGKAGRKKLLEDYVEGSEAGEPWLIPADQFDVQQVKPLTLSDLALADFVELDKKTVAKLLGVPAFVLGVGDFRSDEWNSFISTTVMPLAQILEQELTRKLLEQPDLHFRFSSRSLYNYDIKDLAEVADNQYVRGIMTGNEVRDWIGLSPLEGLDELIILENYIPRGMVGDQSKLIQNGGNDV